MYGYSNPFFSRMANKLSGTSGLGMINRNSDMMAGQTQMPNLNFQPTMAPPVGTPMQQQAAQQPLQSFPADQSGGMSNIGLLNMLLSGGFGGNGGAFDIAGLLKSLKG